jgi:hypothetical protein
MCACTAMAHTRRPDPHCVHSRQRPDGSAEQRLPTPRITHAPTDVFVALRLRADRVWCSTLGPLRLGRRGFHQQRWVHPAGPAALQRHRVAALGWIARALAAYRLRASISGQRCASTCVSACRGPPVAQDDGRDVHGHPQESRQWCAARVSMVCF